MAIDHLPDHATISVSEARELAREIAREEIASLAGLLLRRLQEHGLVEATTDPTAAALRSAFGEALNDFGRSTSEPGA